MFRWLQVAVFLAMFLQVSFAKVNITVAICSDKNNGFLSRIYREGFIDLLVLESFDLRLKHANKEDSIRISVLRDLVEVLDRLC